MIYNHSETERIFKELGYACTKENFTLVSNFLDVHTDKAMRGAVYWLADKLVKTPKTYIEMEEQTKKEMLLDARRLSVQTAERLSPSTSAQNAGINQGISVKPTAEQIIRDAEVIFTYLTKDL